MQPLSGRHFYIMTRMTPIYTEITIYHRFKGTVSRDRYFLGGSLKSNYYFLYERWWFSQDLAAFLWRKFEIKFLLASLKSLTNSENPFSSPLQEACSGVQEPSSVTIKVVCKSECDSEYCSKSRLDMYIVQLTNDSKAKQEQKFQLIIIFLFHRGGWKFINPLGIYRKSWFNLIGIYCINTVDNKYDGHKYAGIAGSRHNLEFILRNNGRPGNFIIRWVNCSTENSILGEWVNEYQLKGTGARYRNKKIWYEERVQGRPSSPWEQSLSRFLSHFHQGYPGVYTGYLFLGVAHFVSQRQIC